MLKGSQKEFEIRSYREEDGRQLASHNFLLMLTYCYHKDFTHENIYCAVDFNQNIIGVGHLEPDHAWQYSQTNYLPDNFKYKLNLSIEVYDSKRSQEIETSIYEVLLHRAEQMRADVPQKINIQLSHTLQSDDLLEVDTYLKRGFSLDKTHYFMEKDLTEELPHHLLPSGLSLEHWKMETEEEKMKYLEAEAEGNLDGVSWSLNQLDFIKNTSGWGAFTAFNNDQVVGSVMTWGLTAHRSATENIFVLPGWREQGVAKALITEVLWFLKQKGKTEATLSVLADNKPAITLYQSLGYQMSFINLEFVLDL